MLVYRGRRGMPLPLRWHRPFATSSSAATGSRTLGRTEYACRARAGSGSGSGSGYESTLPNLRIGRHTRVMFQGFTGRQATINARESLAWGTQVVGGVTPGRGGAGGGEELHLGLPVFPSVRTAVEALRPDATGVYVTAHQAAAAIEEAIEAEVPLVVAVAEHVPLHDMLRVHSILRTQSRSRLVGANSPGIISAVGRCRVGFQPLPCFLPGRVGIAAKSGTLSYEAVASTTRAGLGQSLCIGVGGDVLPGTDLREALSVLIEDPDTDAVALIGEIGGMGELDAADWIRDYRQRTPTPKPIAALIAGISEARGRVMGHAGAFTAPGEPDAATKIKALEAVGVTVVGHPSKFGETIKAQLDEAGSRRSVTTTPTSSRPAAQASPFGAVGGQSRQFHSSARSPLASNHRSKLSRQTIQQIQQTRQFSFTLDSQRASDILRRHGVSIAADSGSRMVRYLAMGIDRTSRSPCIMASPPPSDGVQVQKKLSSDDGDDCAYQRDLRRFPFDYRAGPDGLRAGRIAEHMRLSHRSVDSLRRLMSALQTVFNARQASIVETLVAESLGEITVVDARVRLDPAAAAVSSKAEAENSIDRDTHNQRGSTAHPAEVEAASHGIVYITLPGPGGIGTLVNGAGLAMNTLDALAAISGGSAANFLDTGGKATSETVKKSFELILRDPRVRVVFVNIFGGLTQGDMIARGILLAYEELGSRLSVPVVVRIRGTNEAEGQRIIAESGLPRLFAFDDFDEAAAKAVELSRLDA